MESPRQDTQEGSSPPLFGPDDRPDMPDPGKLHTMSLRIKAKGDRPVEHSFSLSGLPDSTHASGQTASLAVDELRLIPGWGYRTSGPVYRVIRPRAHGMFGIGLIKSVYF